MGFRPKRHGVTFLFFSYFFSSFFSPSYLFMLFRAMPMQHQRWPNLTLSGSASIVAASLPSEGSPSSMPSPLGPELCAGSLRRGARAPCRFSPLRDPNSASVFTAGGSSSVPSHGGKRRSRGRGSKRAARFVPLGLWISCFLHFT
jgi:hypothetical protein